MTGFESRIQIAEDFERAIEAFLTKHADSVAKNGTEHTHPMFVDGIRRLQTDAAKFIRFAPDGVYRKNEKVKHWEAKLSINLEKDAYETYMKYETMGCQVVVFFGVRKFLTPTEVYWQYAGNIRFIASEEVVGRYAEDRRFPIIDGWICPRAKHGCLDYTIGSGTPYREVDITSLNRLGRLSDLVEA